MTVDTKVVMTADLTVGKRVAKLVERLAETTVGKTVD